MQCDYFGICGSCTLGGKTYEEQLKIKVEIEKKRFAPLNIKNMQVIKSDKKAFRNRIEFRIYKIFDENNNFTLHYAMNDINKKILTINSCSIVNSYISNIMKKLLLILSSSEILNFKLFSCEFLG